MSIPVESQIFELERVEIALGNILSTAVNVPVHTRFDSNTNKAPHIDLQLRVGAPTGRRYAGYVDVNSFQPAQPLNSWLYELDATVVTERTQNGNLHIPLIGKVRWTFQYYRLLQTLTTSVSPYHTLTSCDEVGPQEDSVDDSKNIQMSKLTFRGILNIRDSAWPTHLELVTLSRDDITLANSAITLATLEY